jgi:hypothetical protein
MALAYACSIPRSAVENGLTGDRYPFFADALYEQMISHTGPARHLQAARQFEIFAQRVSGAVFHRGERERLLVLCEQGLDLGIANDHDIAVPKEVPDSAVVQGMEDILTAGCFVNTDQFSRLEVKDKGSTLLKGRLHVRDEDLVLQGSTELPHSFVHYVADICTVAENRDLFPFGNVSSRCGIVKPLEGSIVPAQACFGLFSSGAKGS